MSKEQRPKHILENQSRLLLYVCCLVSRVGSCCIMETAKGVFQWQWMTASWDEQCIEWSRLLDCWPSQHYSTPSNRATFNGLVLTENTFQESCALPKASTKNSTIRLIFSRMFSRTWRRVETVKEERGYCFRRTLPFSVVFAIVCSELATLRHLTVKKRTCDSEIVNACWTSFAREVDVSLNRSMTFLSIIQRCEIVKLRVSKKSNTNRFWFTIDFVCHAILESILIESSFWQLSCDYLSLVVE